jgi:hypothetical protein
MRGKIVVFVMVWLALFRTALAQTQLIADGGFTSTGYSPPWYVTGQGLGGVQFFLPTTTTPGYVEMANAANASQFLYQTVTLPTNLIGATLSLYNWTVSSNSAGDDSLSIFLTPTNNLDDSLQQIGDTIYGGAGLNTGWQYGSTNFISYQGSNFLSSLAGQTVDLLFYVATDPTAGYETQFYLTDIILAAYTTADIPVNDAFTNAIVIPSSGTTNSVTTICASRENGEPEIAGNPGGHSLWWTWTAPALGTVTISTAGSDFDTLLGVYTGSALTNLTVVTNSDGYNLSTGLAYVRFVVSQGTQFKISLDGYSGQTGVADFTFNFASDTTRPTVVITNPPSGANVTNSTILVQGTASDPFAITAVQYQLLNANGSNAWQLATGTNAWSATVTNLIPGTNTVRVEAMDIGSNVSTVVSRTFNYIVTTPLSLAIVGEGSVAGATNGQLLHLGYPYHLTAAAANGFKFAGWTGSITTNTATVSFDATVNFSLTANFVEAAKPTLSITAPVNAERWSNNVFNVTGQATDLVGVAAVWYQLDGGAWSTNVNSTNSFTNWNASVPLTPGPNVIKAFAQNVAGNLSTTTSVSFVYVLSTTLTVQTNGPDKLTPNYNGVLLAIDTNYAMTATASKGYVFSNWTTSSGVPITNNPVLKFTMASNLIYFANFIPNPFTLAAGTYEGLFYDTNADSITQAGSGFFSALVNTNGSFTAKFQQGNSTFPISGQFSLTGGWFTNALKTWGETAIGMQLPLTGGGVLEGGLTNAGWTSELDANLAVFSTTNPAPQAGKQYTLILPGTDSPTLPGGNGFGSLTVSAAGSVTFGGTLGDGTTVSQTAIESGQEQWPLYLSLYSGEGMLMGWLTFVDETNRDIDGTLYWFKPSKPVTTLYPAGFTNALEVAGSEYSLPKNARVLELTNGYVSLDEGGLLQSISNQFFLASNNIVTGSNKMTLRLTTTTGLFTGSATNGRTTITFSGAVLQKQTNGFGLFLNRAQSGSVSVAPQ